MITHEKVRIQMTLFKLLGAWFTTDQIRGHELHSSTLGNGLLAQLQIVRDEKTWRRSRRREANYHFRRRQNGRLG